MRVNVIGMRVVQWFAHDESAALQCHIFPDSHGISVEAPPGYPQTSRPPTSRINASAQYPLKIESHTKGKGSSPSSRARVRDGRKYRSVRIHVEDPKSVWEGSSGEYVRESCRANDNLSGWNGDSL